jgi:hypothetical protein
VSTHLDSRRRKSRECPRRGKNFSRDSSRCGSQRQHSWRGTVGEDMMKAQEPSSPQQEEGVLGVATEDKAEGDDTASAATKDAPGAEYTSGGGMKPGGRNSGVGASGGLTEPNDGVYKDNEAGPRRSKNCSRDSSRCGSQRQHNWRGTVGEDMTKAQELSSPQEEEGVLGVAPEDEPEEDEAASGVMKGALGAEYASGGEMKSGGRSSGVGASGGPTESYGGVYNDNSASPQRDRHRSRDSNRCDSQRQRRQRHRRCRCHEDAEAGSRVGNARYDASRRSRDSSVSPHHRVVAARGSRSDIGSIAGSGD